MVIRVQVSTKTYFRGADKDAANFDFIRAQLQLFCPVPQKLMEPVIPAVSLVAHCGVERTKQFSPLHQDVLQISAAYNTELER